MPSRSRHRRRRRRRSSLTAKTLRLRPPYAGTSRIRFDGRRPSGALSARRWRAPVLCCDASAMTPRERLANARLYLVCPARPQAWLEAALSGGGGILQLRDKDLDDEGIVEAAREFKATGALFILNDRPDLADACQADGVHVGQDDATPAQARAIVGPDRIVGRSTHEPAQALAAQADPDVDYLAVGPVHATPPKPRRPPAGLWSVE